MTPHEIQTGAEIAERAMIWVLFARKPDLTNGEMRRRIVEFFGPEVDAALQARFDGTSPDATSALPSE
jgi:hypothetical protein